MTMIAASEAADHLPDHGTLTVRDAGYAEPAAGEERLGLWATDVQPCGTFVRSGIGWLEGAGGDGPLTVRLELHDAPPPRDAWDDVAEMPYRNTDGRVILTWLDGGVAHAALDLGGAGLHRIRAARNLGEYGADTWRLQFWPVDEPEAPRWLVRSRPAVIRPAHVQDALDLPAERVRAMNDVDEGNAHRGAASDVVSVVLWSGPAPVMTSVPQLADRLLMPPEDVRSTLRHAERAGLLAVHENGGLMLTVTAPLVR